jgi:hypothetical protein
MILNSTKLGGNRTKDVEVGPDRQTDSYIPPQTIFAPTKYILYKSLKMLEVEVQVFLI